MSRPGRGSNGGDGSPGPHDHPESQAAAETETILPPREDAHALTVVGLAGSAGSIPAFEAFLQGTPADTCSAYVVVLHLSPDHESRLAELLSRSTTLPVQQVTRSVPVERGHVYVIPPGKQLEMQAGGITACDLEPEPGGTRVAADTFFRTLAEAYGPQAVAVVFSGTGADGTLGVRCIKEVGGLVVAQSPGEAEYDAMPRSVIASGLVDYVLPAATMATHIEEYWATSRRMRLPGEAAPSPEQQDEGPAPEAALQEILGHVRAQTGHDFTLYKRATVLRRIGRRLQVCNLESLPAYLAFLLRHPAEVGALVGDLLISVTQFFRDPPVWETLEGEVISRLFQGRPGEERQVRAWVCGCATGEEAYTLAMLLLEEAERRQHSRTAIQVFATDMDADAVAKAREGIFPETIAAQVSEERLRRWFHRLASGGYQVRKEVRELVLFACHDVLRDTPFSRLDLVTCRNLLIYLHRTAQERVFETFHFALRPEGYLMLGTSEAADGTPLFGLTNKQHRIYARRPVARPTLPFVNLNPGLGTLSITGEAHRSGRYPGAADRLPVDPFALAASELPGTGMPLIGRGGLGAVELHRRLLELYAAPSVLIGPEYQVVHLSDRAGRFLRLAGGEPTRNLLQLVHPDLRVDLRTALYTAASEGVRQTRLSRAVTLTEDAPPVPVRLTVSPVNTPEGVRGYFLVLFEELLVDATRAALPATTSFVPADIGAPAAAPPSADVTRQLEAENVILQRQLRATIEQYEAITEELKASNEELQAMNEEQRSAAEELETSREELQSLNEELSTVNHELRARVEELGRTNSDLQNFLASTDIGTIFLDRALEIQRYTPAAGALFNLIPTDVGRPLTHLTSRLDYPALQEDAERVLSRLAPVEREITCKDEHRHFLARLLPYRSQDDRIEGVVVNLIDISERKRADEARLFLASIVESSLNAIFTINFEGVITSWNQAAADLYGYPAEEAIGRQLSMLTLPEDLQPILHRADQVKHSQKVETFDAVSLHKSGREMNLEIVLSPVKDEQGQVIGVSTIARDVTERRRSEAALRASEERIRTLADAVPQVIWTNTADGAASYFNQRWYAYTGLDYAGSVGPGWQAIVHPDDAPASVALWQEALAHGSVFDTEYRLRRHDGTYRWFLGRNVPLRDPAGQTIGWFGSATDIEELKQAQSAEREAQERFRLMVEGTRDYAMFLLDPTGCITFWSAGAQRIFGWTEAEILGQSAAILFTPEDRERDEPAGEIRTAQEEGRASDLRWHQRKDGTRFWADGLLMRLDGEGGELRGFAKVTRDATDQKRGEEALRDALEAVAQANEHLERRVAERTAELAQMSELRQELLRQLVSAQEQERGRISRDLHDDAGQQITGMLLGLDRLSKSAGLSSDLAARDTIAQLEALAGEIAQKSHRLAVTLRPTALDDLGLVVALTHYAQEWSRWSGVPVEVEGVGMETRLPAEVETTIYRVAQEALTNILRHAVPRGRAPAVTRVSILVQRRANEVLAVIEDDGPGFEVEATLSLPPGQRRLGIFGMQERAQFAGGTLTIESSPGHGTAVCLRLPLAEEGQDV